MSYNILGINPFHNGSACVLSDGEIVYFLEEERLTRLKHDANPFRIIEDILSKFKIDEVVVAGMNHQKVKLNFSNEDPFLSFIRKHIGDIKYTDVSNIHHVNHNMQSFINSGFNEAIGLVFDAGGSSKTNHHNEGYIEQNSIFHITNKKSSLLHSEGLPYTPPPKPIGVTHTNIYGYLSTQMGFGDIGGEGKLMGLSSYGKPNSKIPPLFKDFRTDPNLIQFTSIQEMPWEKLNPNYFPLKSSYDWTSKNSINYNFEKDLAWRIQHDTQNIVKKYVLKYTEETGVKNVVCSGGYFLNCVANYYLTKKLPHINFYFEPIAHDGGTAIGATYWRWKQLNPNFISQKQKTLYYGPQYSKKELLKGIKQYL